MILRISILVLLALTSCRSTVTELRGGREWTVETRSLGPWELTRSETPAPTVWQQRRAAVTALAPRGGWLITIGAVLACLGVALALYSSIPAVDRVAIIGTTIGAGLIAAGLFLVGLAFLLCLLPVIIPLSVVIILYWRASHGNNATT